jgi:predicted nuclease of predicted toxin-antitoxin system
MKLLADENVETALVEWLRGTGHDVKWAAEVFPACPDEDILRVADSESRILLTNDLDFGSIVFQKGLAVCGIVLLRYRAATQEGKLEIFQQQWKTISEQIEGQLVVASNRKIRFRPIAG